MTLIFLSKRFSSSFGGGGGGGKGAEGFAKLQGQIYVVLVEVQ